jgi:hypothetical protein
MSFKDVLAKLEMTFSAQDVEKARGYASTGTGYWAGQKEKDEERRKSKKGLIKRLLARKEAMEQAYGGGPRKVGPARYSYYGQDVGPGEAEDAEGPAEREPMRKYYWRNETLNRYLDYLHQEAGWQGMPKGWDKSSIKKFAKSLAGGGKKKGFFDKCVKKMQDEKGFDVDRAKRFCAGTKDELYGSTYWRGKGKSPQEAGKDVKKHQNV